jgi:hypothetical protein
MTFTFHAGEFVLGERESSERESERERERKKRKKLR